MDRKPPTSKMPPRPSVKLGQADLSLQGVGASTNKENARIPNHTKPPSQATGLRSMSHSKPSVATPKGIQPSMALQGVGRRLTGGGSASQSRQKNTSSARGGQQQTEESKKEMFSNKPSDRFMKIKTADPFSGGKKHKTNFGYVYSSGGVPCRINHGTVNHRIHWDKSPEELDYDPLLINCFEGLLETDHPYSFVANRALQELLQSPGASQKTIPILPKLIMPLRSAFLAADLEIWTRGLEALKLLSLATGPNLTQHIHILLAQLNKKMTLNKKVRESVMGVLNIIEQQGGKEALEVIRSKIPTYTSIFM